MDGLHSLKANTSLEETLQMIDGSIENYEASLLASKSLRNTLVPISVLPPETLCEVFSFVRLLCVDSAGPKHNSLEWINLTYVCRHWRNIALTSPSLWAYLPIGNLKWVEEMLQRSKDCSLVIRSDKPQDHSDSQKSGLGLALEHVHRIGELSLKNISPGDWTTLRTKILEKPAPRLDHFCLRAGTNDDRVGRIIVTKDVLCIIDQLRHLELANCGLSWDPHVLRSLTHLTLHNVLRGFVPDGNRFADLLAGMHALESLDLHYSLPSEKERQSSWASEGVYLARLRTLHIHDAAIPKLEAFFRCITFPPTAVVRVVCHNTNHNQTPDFSGIISGLARSYSNANLGTTFHNVILRQKSGRIHDWGIRLKFFTAKLKHFEMIRHINTTTAHLDLAFYSARNEAKVTIAKVLSDLFASGMPLNDITKVLFGEEIPGLTVETVANTFGKLPRVHSVLANWDTTRFVLDAVTFRSPVSDAAASSKHCSRSFAFPYLSLIYLYNVTFIEDHLVEDQDDSNKLSIDILRYALKRRRKHGMPIDRLTLVACSGVFEEDIWRLEKKVHNIEWDSSVYLGARGSG